MRGVFLLVAAASGWSDLGLGPPLAQQLAGRFAAPLPIQVAAVPLLLEGRDAVVHAETGSGKTLSWALALQGRGAVVVAPSETLCQQLRRECAAIGMAVGDASAVCDVVFGGKELFAVATPYDAMRALDFADLDGDGGPVAEVGRLCLVLDEADALLKTLGKYAAPSAKVERQAVQDEPAAKLIRRTVGRPLKRELESFLKTSTYAREPLAIARVAPRGDAVEASLEQKSKRFVTAPQGVRHLLASIADAPRDDMRRPSEAALDGLRRAVTLFGPAARILVVVADPTASPERVQKALRAAGYNAVALREYTREASDETRVIVARASSIRGIDLAAIDYVVSLGRPSSSDEYLHICGRTARAGRNGTALTLATDHDMGIVKSQTAPALDNPDRHSDAMTEIRAPGRAPMMVICGASAVGRGRASSTSSSRSSTSSRRAAALYGRDSRTHDVFFVAYKWCYLNVFGRMTSNWICE